MTLSRTFGAAVIGCLATWCVVAAQTPNPGAVEPPVLSTVPTPPSGAVPQLQSMSGLPLQVGDLPPGTVAVRVIRGTFANSVGNHPVELRVGAAGTPRTSTTGADGRALFTGVRVGDQVQAVTFVDGEYLESQRFDVPARGGVRLVLVAGLGRGGVAGEPQGAAPAPMAAAPAAAMLTAPGSSWGTGTSVGLVLGLLAVAGGAVYVFGRRRSASTAAGRDLAPAREPVAGERARSALQCAGCGRVNEIGARFCTECGTRFNAYVVDKDS